MSIIMYIDYQVVQELRYAHVVSLIESFYYLIKCGVLLDDDLQELNICWLRAQLSIDTSISGNIIYGANHREVSDEDFAKPANINDFIQSLPQVCIY